MFLAVLKVSTICFNLSSPTVRELCSLFDGVEFLRSLSATVFHVYLNCSKEGAGHGRKGVAKADTMYFSGSQNVWLLFAAHLAPI